MRCRFNFGGVLLAFASSYDVVSSFSSTSSTRSSHQSKPVIETGVEAAETNNNNKAGLSVDVLGKSALTLLASFALLSSPVYADEYGRETEAPTLFTGETTLICVKRGPLGACTKTEYRTEENDNDKADKYFRQPTEIVKRKDDLARSEDLSGEGNALIEKLKKQSEDNKERNDLIVQQKTFMNDQSASFGPFDRQVLILNENGKGFTLLENPQAMRLKEAGFINDKKQFIKQPTQQEIEDALVAPEGPNLLERIFGN